jgi:hypothetical protein
MLLKSFILNKLITFSSLRWCYPVQVRRVKLLRYLSLEINKDFFSTPRGLILHYIRNKIKNILIEEKIKICEAVCKK